LQCGIRLAYHHHVGTVVESEAEIDRLMAVTGDGVSLLLDTGHLAFAGADPTVLARRYRHRIAHVHGVFTVPGDGCIDFGGVLAALAVADYSGWLVVEAEQDPAKAPPLAYARLGFGDLSAAAARAGL
jgi:inosose dehydratase